MLCHDSNTEAHALHVHACRLAADNDVAAEAILRELLSAAHDTRSEAQFTCDLAAITAFRGETKSAMAGFRRALTLDPGCELARHNLALVTPDDSPPLANSASAGTTRIAVLSLLFNWPSTGGGTVHTKELVEFLRRDGYDVRHFYAQQPEWGLGNITVPLGEHVQPIEFTESEWKPQTIRNRFRQVVDAFAPDYVIVTDSWNTKVLLAEAVRDYAYFLRIAAMECICPLNNVRLLVEDGQVKQCDRNQLASPHWCRDCVARNGKMSGGLHRAERELAGFEIPDYASRLRRAFGSAAGVLVVNPSIADLVRPFTHHVHVIPSGFDPARFPSDMPFQPTPPEEPHRILFAGLTQELMKGYQVLEEATAMLWRERQDFEVWVTADPVGNQNEYIRHVGWQSQERLPQLIATCTLMVCPTLAQEALGRTAVEAMGCGKPVVASRLGGLAWVVDDGITGLLAESGDPADLARQVARLLDDDTLREQMCRAGRAKFDRDFSWDVIVPRYRELFGEAMPSSNEVRELQQIKA